MHTPGLPLTTRRRAATAALTCLLLVVAACSSSSDKASSSGGASTAGSTDAAAPGSFPTATTKQLQAAADTVMAKNQVPGAVIVAWDGDKTWTYVPGKADLKTGRKMVADEVFPIRSVTKSFAVTLLLQLVDEGKISLDDPVSKYLPDFRPGVPITVRQVTNMTSGVPDYTTQAFGQSLTQDFTKHYTPDELLAFSNAQPMDFPPGTAYSYSNANTIVVGQLVEKVAGKPFGDVLKERIIDPLKMTHTSYPDTTAYPDPHPVGYELDDTGKNEPLPDVNLSSLGAAGGIVSTGTDLRTWATALVDGKLLDAKTQAERFTGQKPTDGPEYDQYGLGMGEIQGWWGHTGSGLGITAAVLKDPKADRGVVILLNSNSDKDGPAHIAQKLIPIITGS